MAFTNDEIKIITERGFEGVEFPIICTPVNRVRPSGATTGYFYVAELPTQNIIFLGSYAGFIASPQTIPVTKLWASPVTYVQSGKALNGANNIRYSMSPIGTNEGQLIMIYYYADDTLLNISEFYISVTTSMRVGNFNISPDEPIYLNFVYNNYDGTIYPCITCSYISTLVGDTSRYDNVCILGSRRSFQDTNQPWEGWIHQSNSEWYSIESQVPETTEGGGGGGFYRPSDTIGFSGLPLLDIVNFGFVSLYKMGEQNMRDLANYLWSDNFFDNIVKNWQSPFDNIISIGFVPLNTELGGASTEIKIGNINTGVTGIKLSNSMIEKDFGRINFKEIYNNFADYAPFTRLKIYMPSIGVKDLNPDDYMDGAMHLMCYIDCLSGTCVYQLKSIRHGREHVVDCYTGNVLTPIPITGRNFIDAYKSVINGLSSVASGNLGGVLNAELNFLKPTYEKTGSVSGASTRYSVHTPYVFFDTPQFRQPKYFREQHGYVSHQTKRLGDCTGYNEILYIDIDDLTAIDSEKNEILSLLKSGVYV